MYQQPWGSIAPQQQGEAAPQQQQQPWGAPQQPQPVGVASVHPGQPQQQAAWAALPAAAAAAAAPAVAAASYPQQYYQQAAAAAQAGQAQQPQLAGAVPGTAAYYPAAAVAGPPGLRQWVGTVTQIIPPNYGVVDGDAYYINAVVVGQLPKVGDKVRAEGVAHAEGSYKWRVTRLELESVVAAAQPAPRTASLPSAGGPARYGARTEQERQKLREEAAGKVYNAMAPPVAAYTSEVAIASVETSLAGGAGAASQAAAAAKALEEKRALLARSAAELDEEARKRAEQAVAQLGMDPAANPGAKMLARMGFGTTGTGLGRNQQGISVPIDPVAVKGGTGLGFDLEKAGEEERAAREARRAEREARDREHDARRRERDRERRRSRSRSPGRLRYSCAPPKWPTYHGDRGVADVSKRYKDLYLPADFVRPTWQQCCPETNPFPIDRPISFEIKEGEHEHEGSTATPGPREGSAAPAAAPAGGLSEEEVATGRLWSAQVVLAGEKDSKLWLNPIKKLTCLLLKHDKREYGMVGGHWDPQDGGHPASDPASLTRTAARHFKAATGLDLSGCTQWVPFCEFSYLRPESGAKGLPQRMERSVVYLVDAWTLATHNDEADVQLQARAWKARSAASEEERSRRHLAEAEDKLKLLEEAAKAAAERAAGSKADGLGLDGLDPPTMNVQQLQEELTKRGLDTKWNPLKGKKELVERLQARPAACCARPLRRAVEWISEYKVKRAAEDADFRASEEAKAALEAQKEKVREADKAHREARAALRAAEKLLLDPPPTDKLLLHPAGTAVDKKGRSLLRAEPLDVLLDYDDEDNREHGFEVALFAEMVQEMLQQRFGRAILRAMEAIDASKPKRSAARRDGDGKEDSRAAPSSGSKKRPRSRSRSAEPVGDADVAGAEQLQAGDGGDGAAAAAKRQKTEPIADGADGEGAPAPAAGFREHLLTACRFFDRECAGYLEDEDLEEIAYMVSDSLSRKRVQALVDSVTKRSKFSYLEHASLVVPPTEPPAAASGSGSAAVSESGLVVINGMAVDVPALQQRLAAADGARRAAEDAQRAAELAKAEALADKQRAQQSHEEAVMELAQAKEQLAQLAATRSQADMDTSKARVVLQTAELGVRELSKQLAEAMAALGGAAAVES